ncbi:MAG: hypothetical protein NVSMB18_04740 [Acetobacteraceae bacterium]
MIRSAIRHLPAAMATVLFLAGVSASHAAPVTGWQESGEASWYGGRHHGRRTSSGTIFDQNAMTAAHASLPLGSVVRVTREATGDSVVVKITDRQPDHGMRIIDLSRGAASRIGLLASGTGMVTLTRADAEEVEVAEAPDDEDGLATPRRRGLRRTLRAGRAASAAHPCCHAPSVIQVRR